MATLRSRKGQTFHLVEIISLIKERFSGLSGDPFLCHESNPREESSSPASGHLSNRVRLSVPALYRKLSVSADPGKSSVRPGEESLVRE